MINIFACLMAWITICLAAAADLNIHQGPAGMTLQVEGDKDDEWRFEVSGNLVDWTSAPGMGTTFSDADPRPLPTPLLSGAHRFFRAARTSGLFDDRVIRTVHLTFTNSNWATLLTRGRQNGSNTLGNLGLDNGWTNLGIGARYKGNTSFDMGGNKKSVNIEVDYTNSAARLMGYKTVNLNNAAGDETILRESIYFNVMHEYAPSPRGSLARLFVNGTNWGVYSFVEQENTVLVNEWFASNNGDRWRAPNIGGQGPGTGGTFGGSGSALTWLGTNLNSYKANYELKTDNSTNAWQRLMHVINVLNNTPTNQLPEVVDSVLAVDRWLWFLAVENLFADDDSYFNKGADYGFYYEPESGRIHPIEHDGNEAFTGADVQLSPVQGINITARPVLYKLLRIPALKQRYLAHMRTVLEERFNPSYMTRLIQRLHELSVADIAADPKRNFTMNAYTNDLNALRIFVTNRYRFVTNHAELRPLPPGILDVSSPVPGPTPLQEPTITARIVDSDGLGIASVWLYWRSRSYGRFESVRMFDDGVHGDGAAGDGVFGARISTYPAGTKVRYYIEARAGNTAGAATFHPARAEESTLSYRVRTSEVSDTSVIINELMARNSTTVTDPQGEFEDWIELHNISDQEVDLSAHYLTDDPENPRKWEFPPGTRIPARGFLIVWADEDGSATPGLHANFKLSTEGETILLVGPDAAGNALLDSVTFGNQEPDESFGRTAADPRLFAPMTATPGQPNR